MKALLGGVAPRMHVDQRITELDRLRTANPASLPDTPTLADLADTLQRLSEDRDSCPAPLSVVLYEMAFKLRQLTSEVTRGASLDVLDELVRDACSACQTCRADVPPWAETGPEWCSVDCRRVDPAYRADCLAEGSWPL